MPRVCLAHGRPTCPASALHQGDAARSSRWGNSSQGEEVRGKGEFGPGLSSWVQPSRSLVAGGEGQVEGPT